MLEQLTAGMQGLASPASSLPSSKGATSQSATSGCAGLQSVLQQHGLAPAAADGASALLQVGGQSTWGAVVQEPASLMERTRQTHN